eukprot:3100253-Rhodomonas_salina.1
MSALVEEVEGLRAQSLELEQKLDQHQTEIEKPESPDRQQSPGVTVTFDSEDTAPELEHGTASDEATESALQTALEAVRAENEALRRAVQEVNEKNIAVCKAYLELDCERAPGDPDTASGSPEQRRDGTVLAVLEEALTLAVDGADDAEPFLPLSQS